MRINTAVRLQALKLSFFAMAGLALLAIFPAGGLRVTSTARCRVAKEFEYENLATLRR